MILVTALSPTPNSLHNAATHPQLRPPGGRPLTWQVHSVHPSTLHSSLSLYTMPLWKQTPVWMMCFFSSMPSSYWGGRRDGEGGGSLRAQHGKPPRCQGSDTNESASGTVIKTLLDSSDAGQTQAAAKHICVFTWVSLGTWPRRGQVATHWECVNWKQREGGSGCPPAYHFAELVCQLLNNYAESLQLLEHAGDLLTGEAAHGLHI